MGLIEEICTIYANYETFETEVLVASIRSPNHVIESAPDWCRCCHLSPPVSCANCSSTR
jgi:transaldolase